MIKGRITRIPSTSDEHGLQFVPIPIHQAQIGVVSSAGMTINANSMAVVENGTLFLQDGMSNASSYQYIDRTYTLQSEQPNIDADISKKIQCNLTLSLPLLAIFL